MIKSPPSNFLPVPKNASWARPNELYAFILWYSRVYCLLSLTWETKIYSWVFCLQGVYSSAGSKLVINSMSLIFFPFQHRLWFYYILIINVYPEIKTLLFLTFKYILNIRRWSSKGVILLRDQRKCCLGMFIHDFFMYEKQWLRYRGQFRCTTKMTTMEIMLDGLNILV